MDQTRRIVTFDHDQISNYTISAVLQPSIVLPGALPDYAGDDAIPQIFKGDVLDKKMKKIGDAQLHFDTRDTLRYLSIEDNNKDGRLIAEEHFGKLNDQKNVHQLWVKNNSFHIHRV